MLIVNDRLLEAGAPEATLLNRSFKYGDGLFESLRVFNGTILFVDAHLERLFKGMDLLGFSYDPAAFSTKLKEALARILVVNQIQSNGRIRLQIYRGGEGAYAPLDNTPFYLLEGYSLKDDYFTSEVNLSLTTCHDYPLVYNPLSACKTSNALPYVMAAKHAVDHGFDDALLFCGGYVSESSMANIFLVKNQKLITPPLNSACLDGVMRKQIIKLAKRLKVPCQEKRIKFKEVLQADEIFLTNTIRGIMPVRQLEDYDCQPEQYSLVPFLKNCLSQYIHELLS